MGFAFLMNEENALILPQITAYFGTAVSLARVFVLGGKAPAAAWLRQAARGKDVWAIDKGAEACKDAGVKPDYALGDFDSLSASGKQWLDDLGIKTDSYNPDKDFTDFQLALSKAVGKTRGTLVTGCWGGRFDHAFSNVFSILLGCEWGADVAALADESEILIPLSSGGRLTISFHEQPAALSLLPLSPVCDGVTLSGAKWNLNDAEVAQKQPCAISNMAQGDEITVKIDNGTLGVYCYFHSFPF